jgi:hypothetical protein
MTPNDHSKLDVLCERISHVIQSLETIDRKVTDQNHSVAKVKEWIGVHEEQAQRRTQHICENETRLSKLELTLQPVIALVRYPLAFGIGIAVLFFSTMVGLYSSVHSLL